MAALVRPNEVLKRVNGGVGQGQWGHGEVALGQTGVWLWSDRGGQEVGWVWGRKSDHFLPHRELPNMKVA